MEIYANSVTLFAFYGRAHFWLLINFCNYFWYFHWLASIKVPKKLLRKLLRFRFELFERRKLSMDHWMNRTVHCLCCSTTLVLKNSEERATFYRAKQRLQTPTLFSFQVSFVSIILTVFHSSAGGLWAVFCAIFNDNHSKLSFSRLKNKFCLRTFQNETSPIY